MKALFDTNILIDYLVGRAAARRELRKYAADELHISVITWMEVMVGTTEKTEPATRAFLENFGAVPIDETVSEAAVTIQKEGKIKLPDAIIIATARSHSLLLVTRDAGIWTDDPNVRVPYVI